MLLERRAQDPGHPLPRRLRHLAVQPQVRRAPPQEVRPRPEAVRGLQGDALGRAGPRRRDRGDARLHARGAHERGAQGRQARLLREADVQHGRGRALNGSHRPGDGPPAPDRPPAPQQSALHLRPRPDRCATPGSSAGSPTPPRSGTGPSREDLGFPAEPRHSRRPSCNKYGYANMHEFRNWRWFRKYSGGVISDLGAHQIDVFNWMLGREPGLGPRRAAGATTTRTTSGTTTCSRSTSTRRRPRIVRTCYQVLTTTSAGGGYFEYFMGDEGALKMSENPKYTKLYREARAPDWDQWVDKGLIVRPGSGEGALGARQALGEAAAAPSWLLEGGVGGRRARDGRAVGVGHARHPRQGRSTSPTSRTSSTPSAARRPCTAPARSRFATAVTILKVNEAVAARKMLAFAPEDFTA